MHKQEILEAGAAWGSRISRPEEDAKYRYRPGTVATQLLSQFANLQDNQLVQDASSPPYERNSAVSVKAVETYMCFENNTPVPVRVRAMLLFIPNLNDRTDQNQDDLGPRIEMFRHSSNLAYAGMFGGGYLKGSGDATQLPSRVTATILAEKSFVVPEAKAFEGGANVFTQPCKYVSLKKYYKAGKRLYFNPQITGAGLYPSGPQLFTNGNIFYVIIADTIVDSTAAAAGFKFWGVGGCKYQLLKPQVLDNQATLV